MHTLGDQWLHCRSGLQQKHGNQDPSMCTLDFRSGACRVDCNCCTRAQCIGYEGTSPSTSLQVAAAGIAISRQEQGVHGSNALQAMMLPCRQHVRQSAPTHAGSIFIKVAPCPAHPLSPSPVEVQPQKPLVTTQSW